MEVLTWRERRIEDIDVDADIHSRGIDSLFQPTDDAGDSDTVDISCFHDIEAATHVVPQIAFRTKDWCPDSSMNRGVTDQTFLMGDMEKRSMIDTTAQGIRNTFHTRRSRLKLAHNGRCPRLANVNDERLPRIFLGLLTENCRIPGIFSQI